MSKLLKTLGTTIALCFVLGALAQVNDDFSDGDFTNNPTWAGEESKFRINDDSYLQLYDEDQTDQAYISTQSQAISNAQWEFLVDMNFNPSSTSHVRVYLVANQSNLSEDVEGYYVKVGDTEDDVSLYRQYGSGSSKIIDGIDDRLDMSHVNVRVKVTRDNMGNWQLYSDTTGQFDYQLEGSVTDDTYQTSQYFGFRCQYTQTRWDKIWMDDVVVTGDIYQDNEAPEIESHSIIDNHIIKIDFNETMEENSTLLASNYSLSNTGNPNTVTFTDNSNTSILLNYAGNFYVNTDYTLEYQGMTDIAGNEIVAGSISFNISEPTNEESPIVINEIMADPTPVVGLPDAEYLEIFNRTNQAIDINGWKLRINSSEKPLPDFTIAANGYATICSESNASLFADYSNVITVSSLSLTNSGATITLLNTDDEVINTISYTDDWYADSNKDDGGYSIERIDPDNLCSGQSNWKASVAEAGGTPSEINSVDADNIDNTSPILESYTIENNNQLLLTFNEEIDTLTAFDNSNYYYSTELGEISTIEVENGNQIILEFTNTFEEETEYNFTLLNLRDECGNVIDNIEFTIYIYHASAFEILITEIMMDPTPIVELPDAEFIELYNNTNQEIQLGGWTITVGTSSRTLPTSTIAANSYIIISDIDNQESFAENVNAIYTDIPSWPNTSGTILLSNARNEVVHFVEYSETWYDTDYKQDGGWTLEMVDINNPCGGSENWKECINNVGGTPSKENSVKGESTDEILPQIESIVVHQPDSLYLYISETLHPNLQLNADDFTVEETQYQPTILSQSTENHKLIILKFDTQFEVGKIYHLNIQNSITDCVGNEIESNTSHAFAIAETPDKEDIIINEVLFDPISGGSDYVEIYNPSDKVINLGEVFIATLNDELLIDDLERISNIGRAIFPGDYVVISENIESVERNYYVKNPLNLVQLNNLPSYGNESGNVILCLNNLNIIDQMSYHEDMHFSLLKSGDGVALERIRTEVSGLDNENWFSASDQVGFGTPTYRNSQSRDEITKESVFTLSSDIISPDNDGYEDFIEIFYSLDKEGYVLDIDLYDAKGNFVIDIKSSSLLGTEGSIIWDGVNKYGEKPTPGIYLMIFDYFDIDGNKHQERKTILVAKKQ